jgi:hypothetical protein
LEQHSHAAHAWVPETDAERSAIREQLDRILSSSLFKNSKRYPNLLRFVVERALEGHTDPLKERTLGIEVFGREPDYDTNLDPVVRTTAVEIRKRIAQYYHEVGHEVEIRIDFPPGTYMPEFRMPPKPAVVAPSPEVSRPELRKKPVYTAVLLLTAGVFALVIARYWFAPSPLERFWSPVLNSSDPVSIFIGQNAGDAPVKTLMELQDSEKVAFADSTALAKITGLLMSHRRTFRTRLQPSAEMEDLRDGPAILIGAFNNSWALRLTGQSRFHFMRTPATDSSWIQDNQHPEMTKWSHVMSTPYSEITEDWAIVSRVVDPTTGRVVVTASGLAKFGTEAAGDFLTCAKCMAEMASAAPAGWYRQNMQIVIAANVIGRAAGQPRVVATYFW